MDRLSSRERSEPLSPDDYQVRAAATAYYQNFKKPLGVLEQGLADEIAEILLEVYGDGYWTTSAEPPERQLSLNDLEGELGDILWYGSQIVRVYGKNLSTFIDTDMWQRQQFTGETSLGEHVSSRWYKENCYDYNFVDRPTVCLAVLVAQLNDALQPIDLGEASMESALQNLFEGISIAANLRNLSLRQVADSNIAKLAERSRVPHTITHIADGLPSLVERKRSLWLATPINGE